MWGTAYGVPATVSLWVKASWSGKTSVFINGSDGYNYGVQFTVTAGQWQKLTMTIPAPPVGSAWNRAELYWGTGPNTDWVFAPATTWRQNGYKSIAGDTVLPKLSETVAGAMVFFIPTSNIYYIE
jgi:hypothetical protein